MWGGTGSGVSLRVRESLGGGPSVTPQLGQELWCRRHQPCSSWGPQPREGWGKPLSLETFCSRPIGVLEINLS